MDGCWMYVRGAGHLTHQDTLAADWQDQECRTTPPRNAPSAHSNWLIHTPTTCMPNCCSWAISSF
eukprot:982511-Prymnesium_polylepis.4